MSSRNRSLIFWLMIVAMPVPLFFNGMRAEISSSVSETLVPDPSTLDRQPASTEFVYEGIQSAKVAIPPSVLEKRTMAGSNGVSSKSTEATVVPRGKRLLTVVDNACLERRQSSGSSRMSSKGQAAPLSEQSRSASTQPEMRELQIQAYGFEAQKDLLISELVNAAESDECVLEVGQDVEVQLRKPMGATRDFVMTRATDSLLSQMQHLTFLNASKAWDTFFSPGRGITKDVIIAVVDSGIDYNHPDLQGQFWKDANGNVGKNVITGSNNPMDDYGHGTHVAGLIGALGDNGIGVSGIMKRHVKLMAIKTNNEEGSALISDMINGTRLAADLGASVINLSIGFVAKGGGADMTVQGEQFKSAIAYAARTAVIAIAAGNDNKQLSTTYVDAPGSYAVEIAGAISVGSIDTANGARSSYSNYGSNYVQMGAPGAEDASSGDPNTMRGILSTVPVSFGSYERLAGTSMAAPIVAGTAGMIYGILRSEGIEPKSSDVAAFILNTSRIDTSLQSSFQNGRVLDLDRVARVVRHRYLIQGDAGMEAP